MAFGGYLQDDISMNTGPPQPANAGQYNQVWSVEPGVGLLGKLPGCHLVYFEEDLPTV